MDDEHISSNIYSQLTNTQKKTLNDIKEVTLEYYQYTQFKRAYFNCTSLEYDSETGRVCKMNFEVSTKNGSVVFN